MKVIELQIPDDLAEFLPAEEIIVQYSIINFLRAHYLKEGIQPPVEQEYTENDEEAVEIMNDIIATDLEGWQEA